MLGEKLFPLTEKTTSPLKVAYVLLYFPRMTETFIADEIFSLISQNVNIRIVSLLPVKSKLAQPISQQLLKYTWYAPGLLSIAIWRAQFRFLVKRSHLYLALLATFLRQPYPQKPLAVFLKRLMIFLKAVSAADYLQTSEIDLLHTHFAWLSGGAAWICARLIDKPFTVTTHAFDIYSAKNDLLRLVCSEAANVISISEFNRLQMVSLGTCPEKSISVIHCGIDLTKFDTIQAIKSERSASEPLRILSVGSLVDKKGHAILVDACHLLKEKGLNFYCTIIGSGPNENDLRQQIYAYDLQNQVMLSGGRLQPEIVDAYHANDIFVLASKVAADGDRDGIPVVLMEAGREGLPIVSTIVSGIPELVRHMQTGWLVPPDDSAALADAIMALAADPKLRFRLGQNAKILVESQFGIESNVAQLSDLFMTTVREAQYGKKTI